MMNYNAMNGDVSGMMLFAWIIYILVAVVLTLSTVALWKYINKK